MGIEWFRDLSITILGFTASVVLIFIAVIAYRLYRSARLALLSIKAASQSISDIVTLVKEGIKPTIWIVALIQGFREAFGGISKIFKKESDEKGNGDE